MDVVCTCTQPIIADRHRCRLGATVVNQRNRFGRSDRHAAAAGIGQCAVCRIALRSDGCSAGGIRPAMRVRALQLQLVVDPNK